MQNVIAGITFDVGSHASWACTLVDGEYLKKVSGEHTHSSKLMKRRISAVESLCVQNRRRSSRNERLIIALEQYKKDHIKEFMFGLREDV